ncbi:hypothetical protein F5B20DRAFT_584783 [Whalleya microplaca]|nr:hypothetical protein F5B20DRAFT_584783 [Whalleya microplaca]
MKGFSNILLVLAAASSYVVATPVATRGDLRVRAPLVEPTDITARTFMPRMKTEARDSNSTENAARSLGRRNGNGTEDADAENAARSLPLYRRAANSTDEEAQNEKRYLASPKLRRNGGSAAANETA